MELTKKGALDNRIIQSPVRNLRWSPFARIVIVFHKGGSKAAATTKMERFVIIVNGFQPLTIITKRSILDAAAALDPSLLSVFIFFYKRHSLRLLTGFRISL